MAKMDSKLAADLAAQVVGAAADAVGSAYGVPGLGKPVETLVRGLLQVQDEMAESLSRIEQNLQLLVDAPWNTARSSRGMFDTRPHSRADCASLNKAADLLREALARQSPGTMSMAYVALDLAIVLMMLNDREASQYYTRIAIEAGTKYLIGFAGTAASNRRSAAKEQRKQVDVAVTHWYWLARTVDPIFGGWPMDQFDEIHQASIELYMDVRNFAIEAFNRGEGGPEWVVPLAEERKLWEMYENSGLWD